MGSELNNGIEILALVTCVKDPGKNLACLVSERNPSCRRLQSQQDCVIGNTAIHSKPGCFVQYATLILSLHRLNKQGPEPWMFEWLKGHFASVGTREM